MTNALLVNIDVDDLDTAVRFYCDVLRLRVGRRLGAGAVELLGDPAYYRRFGFRPAREFGLRCRWPGTEDAFMALELTPGGLAPVSGLVRYHDAFDSLD